MAWSVNNIERAIEREEWVRALDNLETIASRIDGRGASRLAWRELLEGALWLGPRTGSWRGVIDLVEEHGSRAWSDESLHAMPWFAGSTFLQFDRQIGRATPTALRLARLFDVQVPLCPIGAYALGHFGEDDAARVDHFTRAAELFERLELEALAAHARLRSGTLAMLSSTDAMRGRSMLVDARDALKTDEDQIWWSIGMARSDRWLDRVRGADTVLDLLEERATRDDEYDEDLGHAVIWMVNQAPMRLQATERDRLESLVESGLPDEAAPPMLDQLAQKEAMADLLARPAGELKDALDLRGEPGDDPRDQFYFAVAALEDLDLVGSPDTDAFREQLPVGADVVDVLVAVARDKPMSVATNSGLLEKRFREGIDDSEQLAPLALLWPAALDYLEVIDDRDDVDDTTVRRVRASLTEVAERALHGATRPSYGWWVLAANFLARRMPGPAKIATERAIRSGESVDDHLESEVLALVLDHVIRSDGPDDELVWWLERGEARL